MTQLQNKILIIGNSASGKSTLAKQIHQTLGIAHLDLDTLAWLPIPEGQNVPPGRAPIEQSMVQIKHFTDLNNKWVVEGCYTDLLELVEPECEQLIFLDLPVELCIKNAQNRPWEPHKYKSKSEQDGNLALLLDWIKQYPHRDDVFSHQAHTQFYHNFSGIKIRTSDNQHQLL